MTENSRPRWLEPGRQLPPGIDTSVAHPARVYDYWLGGKDNFAADREAAEQVIEAIPSIRTGVRANRAFLARAVHYLAAEEGIRQFLDIGTGLPAANNTHEVAQRVAPECRVVYVDNDPVVLLHAQALLTSSPEGSTTYIDADLRDPGKILIEAASILDFTQPVAVMLVAVLHLIRNEEDPYGIVANLMGGMPSGSYLVISHITGDLETERMAEAHKRYNQKVATQQTLRGHGEVVRFFDGLELLEPGVVQAHRWRAGEGNLGQRREIANYAGVGRKPLYIRRSTPCTARILSYVA